MDFEQRFTRKFVRVDARIPCEFTYVWTNKEHTGNGTVLDISGGGLKIITSVHVNEDCLVTIKTTLLDGGIKLPGKIVKSELEWYIGDEGKKTFWSLGVQFDGISNDDRRRIIAYVHRRLAEVREARLKKPFLKT